MLLIKSEELHYDLRVHVLDEHKGEPSTAAASTAPAPTVLAPIKCHNCGGPHYAR